MPKEDSLCLEVKFGDLDDVENFLWILNLAKENYGHLPPLAQGLIATILERMIVVE